MRDYENYDEDQSNFRLFNLTGSSPNQNNYFSISDEANQNKCQQKKSQKRRPNQLKRQQIDSFYEKKQKLEHFMKEIGNTADQPLRQDILNHCEKVLINIPANFGRQTIMKLVRNRIQKMIKNKRIKKNWSQEDLKILIWVISKYCRHHGIQDINKSQLAEGDWANIASYIPGVTSKSCKFKWLSLKKNSLAQNCWLEEESLLLDELVKKYGENNWCQVSEQLYQLCSMQHRIYRCPKQCREHWNCYLNPQLKKGPWNRKQDFLLLKSVLELRGVKKWAQIVKMFNGRTQNALKNRFNLIVQKQFKQFKGKKKPNQLEIIENYVSKNEQKHQLEQQVIKELEIKKLNFVDALNKKRTKKAKKKERKARLHIQRANQLSYKEQQEYFPGDNEWIIKPRKREEKKKNKSRDVQHLRVYNNRNEDNDRIFEEDNGYRNESHAFSYVSARRNESLFEEEQILEESKQLFKQKQFDEQMGNNSLQGPDQQAINNSSLIVVRPENFVQCNQQIIQKIRSGSLQLIPCIRVGDNSIIRIAQFGQNSTTTFS